ncbi:uncharacterized protein FFB20_09887 [Fusarium fujikuroi]|nr:uncharacterized protein FFB20_09887 [Fusarium fujikuroi]
MELPLSVFILSELLLSLTSLWNDYIITSFYITLQANFYLRIASCPNSCVLAVYLSERMSN